MCAWVVSAAHLALPVAVSSRAQRTQGALNVVVADAAALPAQHPSGDAVVLVTNTSVVIFAVIFAAGIQFLGCSSAVNWTGPADKTLLLNANESITAVQTCNNKHGWVWCGAGGECQTGEGRGGTLWVPFPGM